jgi:hypothetical protein
VLNRGFLTHARALAVITYRRIPNMPLTAAPFVFSLASIIDARERVKAPRFMLTLRDLDRFGRG